MLLVSKQTADCWKTILKHKTFLTLYISFSGGQTKSGNSLSTVEVYDPITGHWKDAEAMSMLRSRVGKYTYPWFQRKNTEKLFVKNSWNWFHGRNE